MQSDRHFEGASINPFQAEKGPISLTFRHTHPGRFPNKSTPRDVYIRQRKVVKGPLDMIEEGCITETVCIEVSYHHS